MKKASLLIFPVLILILFCNSAMGQIIPSSCTAHDSIVEKYKNDADRLALYRTSNPSLKDSSIRIPSALSDTLLKALIAVYNLTTPERDTVVEIYNIHTSNYLDLNTFTVDADSNLTWMQNLKNNIIPTGNTTVDSLSTLYHLKKTYYASNWLGSRHTVRFTSDSNYNISALAPLYRKIPGVVSSEINITPGDGTRIRSKIYPDHVELIYSYGWGDCPAGCINSRYWKFNCYFDCSVEFAGSLGDTIPECFSYGERFSIDSITACNSYTWLDGITYTASNNTAMDTTSNGPCNIIVKQLYLTLYKASTVNQIDSITACNSYTWIDGITYTSSNKIARHTVISNNCDTIHTLLYLTIHKTKTIIQRDTISACNSYTWMDGITYTSGNKTARYTTTNGACDSIINRLYLTIYTIDTSVTQTNNTLVSNENAPGVTYQWLNCQNNYSRIQGETNRLIETNATNYNATAVEIRKFGCIDTSMCHPFTANCFVEYSTDYDTVNNTFILTVSPLNSNPNSYLWDFGDGFTSTMAAPSHAYTQDSIYNVCLTITTDSLNTCTYCHEIGKDSLGNVYRTGGFTIKTINSNIETQVASTLAAENKYIIFPNPTNGKAKIIFNTDKNNITIRVLNSLGQKIMEQTKFSGSQFNFDMSEYDTGIYFIEIVEETTISRMKLINQ